MAVFNPLGTTGLLTPFLIGSYHEMFTYSANYDKSLKMLHHKLMRLFFLTPSPIGSINARIFILTNRQVVIIYTHLVKGRNHACIYQWRFCVHASYLCMIWQLGCKLIDQNVFRNENHHWMWYQEWCALHVVYSVMQIKWCFLFFCFFVL